MEQEQNPQEVVVTEQKSALHRVTPLSKYLAMALFVLLPFVGGWVGYTFAPEKIVEVEKIIEVEKEAESEGDKESDLHDLVSCYESKDYYVIQSRVDPTNEYIFSYIVKAKADYPDSRFSDCIREYQKEVGKDDFTLETQGPVYLQTFANNRMYFSGGTDALRRFKVYDLDKESYVLEDRAWNLDEMETSADFVRYWSLAKSAHDPDVELVGACLGVEDYIFQGELTYVEYKFETGEEIILEEKCL